jgi:uncharacterized protein YqeY|tara:strand:+ start:809 stop:1252 length:444 start_codon:yes stop_codon:yes gene_type:complete
MKHFEKIQSDMYQAMKSGEKETANTLRNVLAKLKDKQIEKRTDLTQEEEIKTLQTLVKQRKESIDLYQKGGRDELVDQETKEMDIINSYLPKMMDDEKIKEIVESVIKDTGASSMADMGKVMPEVMKLGKGLIDGKTAQQFVSEQLK